MTSTIVGVGTCLRCHETGPLAGHGAICQTCQDALVVNPGRDPGLPSPVVDQTHHEETHPMAEKTKSRSGSRAPKNPKTKAQRLLRAKELTDRIDARFVEVDELAAERNRIVGELREIDGATYREIGQAVGKSEQAVHKAFNKNHSSQPG